MYSPEGEKVALPLDEIASEKSIVVDGTNMPEDAGRSGTYKDHLSPILAGIQNRNNADSLGADSQDYWVLPEGAHWQDRDEPLGAAEVPVCLVEAC